MAALLGGAVAGLVIGAGQALVSSRRLDPRRWIPASTIGMSLGLLLGAATVGYRTSLAELALMGALTGLVLGPAQAVALPRGTRLRWAWAASLPVLWALGWTVTTLGGIAVDEQFTVFGAYGAVTFSALSGLLLHVLLPYRASHRTASALAESGSVAPVVDRPHPLEERASPTRHLLDGKARGTPVVAVSPSGMQQPQPGSKP